jgi:hypothetical protein
MKLSATEKSVIALAICAQLGVIALGLFGEVVPPSQLGLWASLPMLLIAALLARAAQRRGDGS